MKRIKLRVYSWNPNGTNDVEVYQYEPNDINSMEVLETIPEALFGVNTGKREWVEMTLEEALRFVAASPVSDGSEITAAIKKYQNSQR